MKHSTEDAEKKQDNVPQSKRLTDKTKMQKPVNKKKKTTVGEMSQRNQQETQPD